MEVSRKKYLEIIELIKAEGVETEKSLGLADKICILFENESLINNLPPINTRDNILQFKTTPLNQDNDKVDSGGKAKLIPGTKMNGGYVNGQGKFIATTRGHSTKEEQEIFSALNN